MERDRPTLSKRNRNARDDPPFVDQDPAPPKFAPMYIVMPQTDGFRAFQFSADNLQRFTAENLPVFSAEAFQSYAPGAAVTPAGLIGPTLTGGASGAGGDGSLPLQRISTSQHAPLSPHTPHGHRSVPVVPRTPRGYKGARPQFSEDDGDDDDDDGDNEESDGDRLIRPSKKAQGKRRALRQESMDRSGSPVRDREARTDETPPTGASGTSHSQAGNQPPPPSSRGRTEQDTTSQRGGPHPRPSVSSTLIIRSFTANVPSDVCHPIRRCRHPALAEPAESQHGTACHPCRPANQVLLYHASSRVGSTSV